MFRYIIQAYTYISTTFLSWSHWDKGSPAPDIINLCTDMLQVCSTLAQLERTLWTLTCGMLLWHAWVFIPFTCLLTGQTTSCVHGTEQFGVHFSSRYCRFFFFHPPPPTPRHLVAWWFILATLVHALTAHTFSWHTVVGASLHVRGGESKVNNSAKITY